MEEFNKRIEEVREKIKEADAIIIGAGSGLSTAAGLEYSGKSFEENYSDFIAKYGFKDLYSASFYDFETQEEKWAFFARMIKLNRYNEKPLDLYVKLLNLVKDKDYFVLSTNVDGQFYNAGFDSSKVFETQGDYGYLQCEKACHNTLYDNREIVNKWIENTNDCKIPSSLVMKCPKCGENMDMNLRKDDNFVQDSNWYTQNDRYSDFLDKYMGKKVVMIEIGVGFNTPGIIRIPFERIVMDEDNYTLVRINKEYPQSFYDLGDKIISFKEDTNMVINEIMK